MRHYSSLRRALWLSAAAGSLLGMDLAEEAKKVWVKIIGNRNIGAYEIIRARGDLGDTQWPDHSYEDLIKIGFRDKLIDNIDHPVIRDLYGEI
jgi:hypothetical protein